ncbi:hypothetical protein [Psychrobacillus sp. BM2]|uniref:hypothetical protein n=1 Tax=Psychrobacillus sp. BM2 TaxID=3400421 RepID=UPI003B0205F8
MINIDSKRYKYIVTEYEAFDYYEGELHRNYVVGIGLKDLESNMIYPSPFNNYIKSVYRRKTKSLSNQRNAAYELIKFLNYINKQITKGHREFTLLKEEGVFGITLMHGSQYISHLSLRARAGKLSSPYVYRIEGYLINFYHWLFKQELISEPIDLKSEESPFDDLELGTIYPGKDDRVSSKLVDFGENRYELSIKFIRLAEKFAPDIALGIAFQFFGGLRAGEVVNLTKDGLERPNYWNHNDLGEDAFVLKIRDRQQLLFDHRKNQTHEQVKRSRNQSLLVNPILSNLFKKHRLHLSLLEKKGILKNSHALFVSSHNGEAISGKRYYEKFNGVKKEFFKQLIREENIHDYEFLSRKNWSTHICRGVFTNFLLDIGSSVAEVAIARGDRNIMSVLSYVEEQNAIKLTNQAINLIREAYKNQTATIDARNIQPWRNKFYDKRIDG